MNRNKSLPPSVDLPLFRECPTLCKVSSLLRDHPEINVNWTNGFRWAPLHIASFRSNVEVVKLLLAHPNIIVNGQDVNGSTPFLLGCWNGHVSVVRALLKDPRVNVTLEDNYGCTPLWCASFYGHHEVIEGLIASGKDLGDIKNKKGNQRVIWGRKDYTALEIARKEKKTEVVTLLERFMANPAQTRHEIRVKLGVLDELTAEVFALTVFLCDDQLQLKPAPLVTSFNDAAATRFFAIAFKLPMELQMVLCHRAVGSMRQNILHNDSEAAFKSLARILLVIK